MTQRPDLMKVALPAVGVMDMLRYHTFTAGAGWAYDYGTSQDSKEMFEYIKGYSPVQNVKAGTHYPATMVTTGDPRVMLGWVDPDELNKDTDETEEEEA